MKIITHFLLLLLTVLASGCATTPIIDKRPEFSLQPLGENGRLIVSAAHIPKNEPGVDVYHFLALAGGAKTIQVPFNTKLYDVTNKEPEYLGNINWVPNARNSSGWLEHSIPAGKRLLMLDRSATYVPDFLEVDIKPGETTHVAISQYGYMSHAYLGEIAMEKQDYDFCVGLKKQNERAQEGVKIDFEYNRELYRSYQDFVLSVDKYMGDNRINLKANMFRTYCINLALPTYVNILAKTDSDEFEKSKLAIIALRDNNIEKWKSDPENKKIPFDLRRDGIKKTRPCSNEIRVCQDGTKVMRTEKNCEFENCPP